jgi:hypothetical protein
MVCIIRATMSYLVIWMLFVAVCIAALAWALLYRPRLVALADEPRCGKCGYIVRGLPSRMCPECGANLDDVGTPIRKPIPPLRSSVRTLGWFLLVIAVFGAIRLFIVQTYGTPLWFQPKNTWQLTSNSGLGIVARLRAAGAEATESSSGVRLLTFQLRDPQGARLGCLDIELPARSYAVSDSQGGELARSDKPLDLDAILLWMRANGIDTGKASAQQEAQGVLTVVNRVTGGTDFPEASSTGTPFGVQPMRMYRMGLAAPPWFPDRVTIPCALVLGVVVVAMLRRLRPPPAS